MDIAVIGAGPYGLAIGAHLAADDAAFRVFGRPMDAWRSMPLGMCLKSEGFASSLYDPESLYPLRQYCSENGIGYADIGTPVALDTFVSYGMSFARLFLPELDERNVSSLRRDNKGFALELDDGDIATARRVVVATGVRDYAYVPPSLRALASKRISHSSEHSDVQKFAGQRVAIVGGGSSALDLAALANRVGADVTLVCRGAALDFQTPPSPTRSWFDRARAPLTCIGPSWVHRFYTDAPLVFHALPSPLRERQVRTALGPSGAWFIKDALSDVDTRLGTSVLAARELDDDAVRLELGTQDGGSYDLEVDEVIAATGYSVDLRRLPMLAGDVRAGIATSVGSPRLSRNFESSVENLYFVGLTSAQSFGPMMRFACGARFTATRLTSHLMTMQGRRPG